MNLSETVFVLPPPTGGGRPAENLHPDAGDSVCGSSGGRHHLRLGAAGMIAIQSR